MERRKFTREFKLEAVRLIKDRGVSHVQASQDLNVHTSQLRDWVKKFSEDPQHAFPGHGAADGRQRRPLFDEPIRQRLGQRRDGELLLVAEDRAHQQQNVQDAQ